MSRSHVELAENLKGKDFADLLHKKIVSELSQSHDELNRGSTSKAPYHWPIIMLHWRWLAVKDEWEEPEHTNLAYQMSTAVRGSRVWTGRHPVEGTANSLVMQQE